MSDTSVPDEVTPQVSDLPVVSVTRQPGVVSLRIQLPSEEMIGKLRRALELRFHRIHVERLLGQLETNIKTGEEGYTHFPLPTLHMDIREDDLNLLHEYLSDWCRINELQLNFTLAAMPALGS